MLPEHVRQVLWIGEGGRGDVVVLGGMKDVENEAREVL